MNFPCPPARSPPLCAFLFPPPTLNSPGVLATLRIKNLALVTDLTLSLRPVTTHHRRDRAGNPSSSAPSISCSAAAPTAPSFAPAATVARSSGSGGAPTPPRPDKFLEDNGLEPCAEGQLILKRVFSAAGANRQFINGSPATLQALAALGRIWLTCTGRTTISRSSTRPANGHPGRLCRLDGLRGQFAALAARRANSMRRSRH